MFVFTVIGYIARKLAFSLVSLFIGFMLAPMLEHSLRQTLTLYGNLYVLFTRPVALPFMLIILYMLWKIYFKKGKTDAGNRKASKN